MRTHWLDGKSSLKCVFSLTYDSQPIKRKKEGEQKKMSQEEMLLEAAQTGWSNFFLLCKKWMLELN